MSNEQYFLVDTQELAVCEVSRPYNQLRPNQEYKCHKPSLPNEIFDAVGISSGRATFSDGSESDQEFIRRVK